MSLNGQASVIEDLAMARSDVAVVSGTLTRRKAAAVAWDNLYVCPPAVVRGTRQERGNPMALTTVTAWRVGGPVAPRTGDQWTVGGIRYEIQELTKIYNDDEDAGYCVYETSCTRLV